MRKTQRTIQSYLLFGIFIFFFVLFIAFIFDVATTPKTPATAEQVWDVLVEQGYEPCDVTESYSDYSFVTNCIEAKQGDIRFDFFVCTSDSGASAIYKHFYSIFVTERRYTSYAEYTTHRANYVKYGLKSNGQYSIVVRVGSTIVYAECNEENMQKTNRILDAFDYLNY